MLDPTDLSSWLADIGREFRQYGFNLIQAGVDRKFLPHLTDTHLKTDCQVKNQRWLFVVVSHHKNKKPQSGDKIASEYYKARAGFKSGFSNKSEDF